MSKEEMESIFLMINRDLFLFLMGLFLIISIGLGAKVWQAILRLIRGSERTVAILEAPEQHGFGTEKTDKTGEHLIRIAQSSAKIARWQAEELTGNKPPPLELD